MTFRTRLTASLVCRQWHRFAFTTRFLQQVQLTLEIRQSQCLAEAIDVLRHSERAYRRLKLIYQGNTQQSLVSLTELLETVRGIRELDLLFFFYCFREKLNIVVNEVLSECGCLESFTIGIRGRLMSWIGENRPAATAAVVDLEKEAPRFPALTSLVIKRNPDLLHPRFYEISQSLHSPTFYVPPEPETLPNLRHLTMNCETAAQLRLFAACAERLESAAIVSFDGHGRFIDAFLELRLPQVQSLTLPGFRRSDTGKLCQFLKVLRRVNVLQMEQVLIDDEVIETLFEHCATLKQLVLYMELLPAGCLRGIARLEKLEKLRLVGKVQNGWVNHEDYFRGAVGGQLRLNSLTISHFVFTSGDFVTSIAAIFVNLKELRISDCRAKNNIIGPIAEALWFLRSLEYNKVTHGGVRPAWPPFLNHVKLVNCAWASGDFLNKLIEQCPRLKRLSLSACGASREAVQRITEAAAERGCVVERTISLCHSEKSKLRN
uniref:F-box domain-containing protein n=1 Tax=Culex tarsalis TaxID=7177 RepID=A0A1Q3F5G7_CULTA